MKHTERHKIQKLVDKITSGKFDENDVDHLFLKLREYAGPFHLFREVADLVAHNSQRDKGIAVEAIHRAYLTLRFLTDYPPTDPFNIRKPFPSYVRDLIVVQLKNSPPGVIKNRFRASRESLAQEITKRLPVDKSTGKCQLHLYYQDTTHAAIEYILENMFVGSIAMDVDIFEQLVKVIRSTGISIGNTFTFQKDRVTAALLLLFHYTSLMLDKSTVAVCKIYDGSKAGEHYLDLQAEFPLQHKGKSLVMSINIIGTSLVPQMWADELVLRASNPAFPPNIKLSDNFRFVF
jgi:hypothetical protein